MELLRFKKDQKYLVFDFETESLNLCLSRPWQASYLVCDKYANVLESHDDFIDWPDFNISADAARITNFDWERYNELKRPARKVWDKFSSYLFDPQYELVGHNILKFDVPTFDTFSQSVGAQTNYPSWVNRCIDTNVLSKAVHKELKPDHKNRDERLAWQFKVAGERFRGVRTSLSVMCKFYDIPYDEAKLHDGLYDIGLNAKLLQKLIYEVEI